MKRLLIILYALSFIVLSGCTNEPIYIAFSQSEMILKQNESSSLPLSYQGICFENLIFEFSQSEIAIIENEAIKATKVGFTILTVFTQDRMQNAQIEVIVEAQTVTKPVLYAPSDYLLVGMQTPVLIENEDSLGASRESFTWQVSDESIIEMDGFGIISAKSQGKAVITATLKSNPSIVSDFSIEVGETSDVKDPNGEIGEGRLILRTNNQQATIQAGEYISLSIDGANDINYYVWKSYSNQIAMAASGGKVVGVAPGKAIIAAFSPLSNKIYGTITVTVYGEPNVDFASRLVQTALDEEGYVEGYNNDSKYGDWWGIPNGEWCAMFVSWCANESGITTSIIPKYAAVVVGREWFEERGLFHYKDTYQPQKGDIIFFLSSGASHTGIVVGSDATNVYTIEGNTADRVAQRSYPLSYKTITGYGTPNYPPFS
jgi:hypothetical protein